jgi:hypothetical protein
MEKLVKITLVELFFQRFFCHLGPLCGSGDGQKQVGTDGDFVGKNLRTRINSGHHGGMV